MGHSSQRLGAAKSAMCSRKKSYSLRELNCSKENILQCNTGNDLVSSTSETNKLKPTVKHKPFLGFFYMFLTSLNFTLASVMVKKLPYIDPGQLSLIRNVGVFVGSLPVAIYCTKEVFGAKNERILLLTRGFLGATALYLNLTAYRYLPLAEAAIVLSSVPALTTLIARVYLKESCGLVQSVSLFVTICGVLTSVRLPELMSQRNVARFDYYYVAGLAAAVGCVITLSLTFVALRKMKGMHFSVPMLYFGFIGMIQNASINASTSSFVSPRCGWDQVMYMLIGTLGFISNCTFTLSIQVEAAGIVSVLKSSMDIIAAMVFQILFFSEKLDVYNITGGCLVIASVSIMGIRNWLLILPEESKTRKRLKHFLL